MTEERDVLEVDVLFVGGGIASLSSALHLSNLIEAHNEKGEGKKLGELMIAVIEKGASFGAHGISGAVMDPGPLKELVPDFLEKGAPLEGEVKKESIYFLTKSGKIKSPITPASAQQPRQLRRLHVEAQPVDGRPGRRRTGSICFRGFAGVRGALRRRRKVIGVRTGDKGVDAKGEKKSNYEPGHRPARPGDGVRRGLARQPDQGPHRAFRARRGQEPGRLRGRASKRSGNCRETRVQPGEVIQTMGYPLKSDTFGGGFIYGMKDNMVSIGQLISLDYSDPFLDPHREFQKFKLHPLMAGLLKDGKLVQYGAKTVPVGGLFSIPKLAFPGGMIIGDAANLFNSQKIKGIDLAMRSGMLAAETIFDGSGERRPLRATAGRLRARPWLQTQGDQEAYARCATSTRP